MVRLVGWVSSMMRARVAFELPAPIDLAMAVEGHTRTKRSGNGEKEVVLGDPCPQTDARSLGRVGCSAKIVLLRIGSVESAVARADRCLYRPPHVAASSAPVGHQRRRRDEVAALWIPRADQKLY